MARTPVTFCWKDFYKSYLQKTQSKTPLSAKEHRDILDATGEVIKETMIQDNAIKLFGRLGVMMIRKVKPKGDKRAPIDFQKSKEYGINVYHFNDHSDGFIARAIWERKTCVLADKHMWQFKPVRAFRRALAQVMKSGDYQYPILTK